MGSMSRDSSLYNTPIEGFTPRFPPPSTPRSESSPAPQKNPIDAVPRDTYVDYVDTTTSNDNTLKASQRATVGFHVKILWVCLSVMVTVGCSFSLLQPHWFSQRPSHALGLFTYCVTDSEGLSQSECGVYGGFFRLGHLPSNAWQVACLLYGGGCVLLAMSSLAAILCLVTGQKWTDTLSIYTGYLQTIAVVLLVIALVVFPVGLDSPFVRHHCGQEARTYSSGQCHVGWAYILAIVSTSLAMFAPVLSQYTECRENSSAEL